MQGLLTFYYSTYGQRYRQKVYFGRRCVLFRATQPLFAETRSDTAAAARSRHMWVSTTKCIECIFNTVRSRDIQSHRIRGLQPRAREVAGAGFPLYQNINRSILIRIKACIISHLKDFHDQVSRRIVDFDRSALDLIPETLTTPDRIRII